VPIVLKSESLSLLEPYGPVQACTGIALPFYFYVYHSGLLEFCNGLSARVQICWQTLCPVQFWHVDEGKNGEIRSHKLFLSFVFFFVADEKLESLSGLSTIEFTFHTCPLSSCMSLPSRLAIQQFYDGHFFGISHLKTKQGLLYLKRQSVPRSAHISSRF
jgi:hypothetical protein